MIDAIIRHWYKEVSLIEIVGIARTDTHLMKYVDESKPSGHNPLVIRQALDLLVDLLARTGMWVNTQKTKTMIVTGGKIIARQSNPAYERRMTGEGETHREKKRTQVMRPMCEATMQEKYLPDHIRYIQSRRRDDTSQNDDEVEGEEEKEGEADEAVGRRPGRSYPHDEHGGQRQHGRVPQISWRHSRRYT
jgi:hypothetical protein